MLSRLRFVAAFVLLLPYALSFAQGVADLAKSPPVPESIEIKDLPSEYRAVTLRLSGGDSYATMMQAMFMPMAFGIDNSRAPDSYTMMDMMQVSWTNGQTIKSDTGEFLVTYRLGLEPPAPDGDGKPHGKLRLALVRKDAIVEIAPRPDLTRDHLAELFSPTSLSTRTSSSTRTHAMSNMKQLALGMIMYESDYDDVAPYVQDTKSAFAVTMPYLKNTELFKSLNPASSRILFNMSLAGTSAPDIEAPTETILYYDPIPWNDGKYLVSFVDGHVKYVGQEEWPRIEKSLHLKLKRRGKPLPPAYWKKIAPGLDLGN